MLRATGLGSVALLALAISCGAGCSVVEDDTDDSEEAVSASDASAALEVHALDIWARVLDDMGITLTMLHDGRPVRIDGTQQTSTIYLKDPGTYAMHLEAPMHAPLDVSIRFDGSDATIAEKAADGGFTLSHTQTNVGGRKVPSHVLNMGLRHTWFSAEGRPARHGNNVTFMMDGEEAWSTVKSDLVKSTKDVLISTWWWQSDFELSRSPIGTSRNERWKNSILGILESRPSVEKKVIVGEFIGQNTIFSLLNTDDALRKRAYLTGDHFEMMSQANETRGKFRFEVAAFPFGRRVKSEVATTLPIAIDGLVTSIVPPHDVDLTQVPFALDLPLASFHQKFMVVDDSTAYVGGMNLKSTDWDTSAHKVYEPNRMDINASDRARQAVLDKTKKPDLGPRKDYMVRLDGPVAQDVADVFHERWEHLRDIKAHFADKTTTFQVQRNIAPRAGGMDVQLTATMPSPFNEHAISETWFNAVNNAEKFIYIEDQYFRMPMIHDAIAKRMTEKPALKLVVITKPVGNLLPECRPTNLAAEFFRTRFGDRFLPLQLKAFDADTKEFGDFDVHSKMLIVDDIFMSVGSANKNNRGMIYEAEMNVAIVDASVGTWRKRIFQNLLGTDVKADTDGWFKQLSDQAKANDAVVANGQAPTGFVYTLIFGAPAACKMQSIGADAT